MADQHGTARFATLDDLKAGKWLGPQGLPLGEFFAPSGLLRRSTAHELRLADDTHHLVVSGAGGGKYVSSLGVLLFDFLMRGDTGPCIVIDPKGEALENIGKLLVRPFERPSAPDHLADFPRHYEPLWLDPYDVCRTGFTCSLNFLRALDASNPEADDDARLLAQAIVGSKDASGSSQQWDEAARNFMKAVLLYVAQHDDEAGRRDLVRVRRIVSLGWEGTADPATDDLTKPKPETLQSIAAKIANWPNGPDAARNPAGQVLGLPERTRESVLLGIYRDTDWIDSAAMGRVLADGPAEIDIADVLANRRMLFVVLPDKQADSHKAWLRLAITTFSNAFKLRRAGKTDYATRRHMFIDEFPSLGKLDAAARDLAVARGFNVQYHVYCQSLGQLQSLYREMWENFVTNSVVQAFHVGDLTSQQYISKKLGITSMQTRSASYDAMSLWAKGSNEGAAARALLHPDEVGSTTGKDTRQQLLMRAGNAPILCGKLFVYEWARYRAAERFTLAEVFETIDRAPNDAAEEARFVWWR